MPGSVTEHEVADTDLRAVEVDHLEVRSSGSSTRVLPTTVYSAWRPVNFNEAGYGTMTRRVTHVHDLSDYPLYVFPGEPGPPVPYGHYEVDI